MIGFPALHFVSAVVEYEGHWRCQIETKLRPINSCPEKYTENAKPLPTDRDRWTVMTSHAHIIQSAFYIFGAVNMDSLFRICVALRHTWKAITEAFRIWYICNTTLDAVTKQVGLQVTLYTYILEVIGWNHGRHTGWRWLWFVAAFLGPSRQIPE